MHRISLVHRHALHCFGSEVKVLNSCFTKAKAFQVRFANKIYVNNCLSFGNKSTSSRIPMEHGSFVSVYTLQNRRFSHYKT